MTIHPGSTELLAAVPQVLEGTAVRVVGVDGAPEATFGAGAATGAPSLRIALPAGAVEAFVPGGDTVAVEMVRALVEVIAARERLEGDMESMSASSLRLLEQVAMIGETLPRLSAGVDDLDIATLGVRACLRAAGVRQVVYLGYDPNKGCCEVVVLIDDSPDAADQVQKLDPLHPVDRGLLADVFAVEEGVVLRTVPAGGRLGAPGSPEHLAERQILGVPVTYGSGDKRVLLGALLLLDKEGTAYDAAGDLGNEEGQLAESFAAMLGAVLGARQTASLGKELSLAREIQRQILPAGPVVLRGFDIAADYRACGAVGGDYFDYVPLADGRTMAVVADVSGHNLASGMMMVSARATLRTLASVRRDPAKVFADLAESMYPDLMRTERFLTAAAVALRDDRDEVEYVCAGHNDLFVYRAGTDRVERLRSDSMILGFMPQPGYLARHVKLAPGDTLLLYTDGVTEAMDAAGEMFGEDRLATLFAQLAASRSARAIVDGIVHELDRFRGGDIGGDDVTAVVIRFTGKEERP